MKITETPIPGLFVIDPRVFEDERGYFFESFNQLRFEEQKLVSRFVQDNESKSSYGVIRGLHYQLAPYSQTKLVRVISGSVFDVAVDLREGSPTFGQWYGVELTAGNKKQFYIPKGFAHGFSVLSDYAVFAYKCDDFYNPSADRGISYDDPSLNIDWMIPSGMAVISEKDKKHPSFADAEKNFKF